MQEITQRKNPLTNAFFFLPVIAEVGRGLYSTVVWLWKKKYAQGWVLSRRLLSVTLKSFPL